MRRVNCVLLLFLISLPSMAIEGKTSFLKLVQSKIGDYALSKGSSARCSDGELVFVDAIQDKGFRLGQSIFIGPFDDLEVETTSDGCKTDRKFTFSETSVTELVRVYDCPKALKESEVQSTKIFTIDGNKISFTIKETDYKCFFEGGK